MANDKISVDDILIEVDKAKHEQQRLAPQSDMNSINDLIEQILLEKKNKQLKACNEALSIKDRENLEKEIKIQTKNIAKLYEKTQKEETKRLKKQQNDVLDFIKGLSVNTVDFDVPYTSDENDFEGQLKKAMKVATIHPEQSVKLTKSFDEITQSLPNKNKIEAYAQSAHLDHIKREAMNITAHFGVGKDVDDQNNVININSYRKYKKSRDEKIDSFVLDKSSSNPKPLDNDVSPNTNTDNSTDTEHEPIPSPVKHVYEPQIDSSYVMSDDKNYSLETQEGKQKLATMIHSKKQLTLLSVVGLFMLSVCAVVIMLAKISPKGITLFTTIEIEPTMYLRLNLVLLVSALAFSPSIFKNTVMSLVTREPSRDILYLTTSLITVLSIIMLMLSPKSMLMNGVFIFSPVVILSLFFNSLSRLIVASKAIYNLDRILDDEDIYGISIVDEADIAEDMTKGILEEGVDLAVNTKVKQFTCFVENSFKCDRSDEIGAKTCIFTLPAALMIGIFAFLLTKNMFIAMTVFSCIMALSTTFIGALLVSFPLLDTSKITQHFSGMSPCVSAIQEFENTNAIAIDAFDLFPTGTVKLMGIKTFSGKRIDNAIVNASSVLCECKSALSHVFMDVIANDKTLLKPVDSIIYEDLMGISAWVDNKRVLIGNRDLMINHSISVPKQEYEDKYTQMHQDVVYIATDGDLCAAFILGVTTKKGIYDSLNMLRRNGIKIIIKSVDSIFTASRIASVFRIDSTSFKILPSRLHRDFLSISAPRQKQHFLIGNNGSVLGYLITLVATKKLSACIISGMIYNVFSIILGTILVCGMYALKYSQIITSLNITIYMLIIAIIYWIAQKNSHI